MFKLLTLLTLGLFYIGELSAQEFYLSQIASECPVQSFKDGKLESVNPSDFYNLPLTATKLKNNPKYSAFKVDRQVYVTPKKCLFRHIKTVPKPPLKKDKYYVEFGTGLVWVFDQSQVPSDYNSLFPSKNISTPVKWSESDKTPYSSKSLFHLGFGMAATPSSYFAFKLRFFKGAKTDSVILTDINTGTTSIGNWKYNDLFINGYVGYKMFFDLKPSYKMLIAGYAGFSKYSSNLSDGTNKFELNSFLVPVFLLESGVEYRIETQVGLGATLGYEYLGKKSLKVTGAENVKSKMSYSNTNATLAVKYYY
jgi:hypothetical protein